MVWFAFVQIFSLLHHLFGVRVGDCVREALRDVVLDALREVVLEVVLEVFYIQRGKN